MAIVHHRRAPMLCPPLPPTLNITPAVHYFGTPVALISTVDETGHANLTPMSSVWALGDRLVLGLSDSSQGAQNLLRTREAVVNLPGPHQYAAVEAIARTTGRHPVPEYKRAMGYCHEPDKFALAGFSAVPATKVQPPRVAECPLQLEVRLIDARPATQIDGEDRPGFLLFETQVLLTHAHADIVHAGSSHIDTARWSPLLYVYRHYFGAGERLGRNFRAQT